MTPKFQTEHGFEDEIAELLREERARHRISLDSVAAHCCVTVPAVSQWEHRTTKPISFWHLRRWVEAVDAKLEVKVVTKDGKEFTF